MLLARSALVALLLALPLATADGQATGGPLTIVVNHFGKEVLDPDLEVLGDELRKLNRETHAEYPFYPIAARHTTFAVGPRVADWSPGDYGVAWHLETVKARR